MKKIKSLILSIIILVTFFCPTIYATENQNVNAEEMYFPTAEESEAIIEALNYVEKDKINFGLNNVRFDGLEIGEKLVAYEYRESNFIELYSAFPIIYNDKMVALATKISEENYQITTDLADAISLTNISKGCIVYDTNSAYLFDGVAIHHLMTSEETINSRGNLLEANLCNFQNDVLLSSFYKTISLNYRITLGARTQTYWSCGVKYVKQGKNLCWAATVACINNYINGTNLTSEAVAKKKFGNSNYNNGLADNEVCSFMNSQYKLGYAYKNQVPSNNAILKNIKNKYPIYGSFISKVSRHAVTIYGVNLISGYITVMNPSSGSMTIKEANGKYSYVSSGNGYTYTMDRGICKYW